VRTTLKRRSAWNGSNGRAVAAAPPPPPVPAWSSLSRYGEPPRRGILRFLGKAFLWLVVLVLMGAGAVSGGVWLYLNESVEAVRAHSPEAKAAQEVLDVATPGEPTVALVIGYDKRAGIEASEISRSDTVMLLRADPKSKVISMLSFPRDLIVDIPGCEARGPFRSRINEAYTYCGPKGTLQTVKQLTGIPVNYLITVNFRGFKQIVNSVGGVYLDVDRRYFNDNSGYGPNYATIDLQPGYQKLNGGDALDYVRYRHTDSDFFRIKRQQEFVKAFKQRVGGLVSITKLPGIVNSLVDNVEVGVGGGKKLDLETLYGYAKLAYELPAGNFVQVQIDPGAVTGYAELSASGEAVEDAVRQFLHPDPKAARKAADVATRRKPQGPEAPPPASVSIEVWNGNGVDGAAGQAAYLLGQRGYVTAVGGSAPSFDYFHTEVVYDPELAGANLAAKEVAELFGDGEVREAAADDGIATTLKVTVGRTFKGTLGPGIADKTPTYEPPAVTRDTDDFQDLLRAAQPKIDFTLYVPTVREETSYPDTEVPMRAYRAGGHDAVRLVYRYGGRNEWWGIQQTSWTDAPALDGASVTRTIKGRTYRLFFNGSKLHLVAFEENGAVYWVVNTLLDKLSNETMLAVAKGLRPLGSGG
jgi:LCP family protein required for cell wall assembly